MPRIRNILQHRADRFRNKQAEKKLLREDTDTDFNDRLIIKPKVMEPDGASSESVYSLEAKGTHATTVETFSSGEDNTTYSDEKFRHEGDGEFLDLAYEASRQEKNSLRGHELIDLVPKSSTTKESDIDNSMYRSFGGDEDDAAPKNFARPDTIKFVDSEDGKVFNIRQEITKEERLGHSGYLQNVRSLDDSKNMDNDECSQTLNTNIENLEIMSSLDDGDTPQTKFSNRFESLHVDIREEGQNYEECELEATAYEHVNYDEDLSPQQDDSQLYDCDDGEMFYPVDALENQQGNIYSGQGVQSDEYDVDGNFFEQIRSVQSRHINDYQTHPESIGIVDEEVEPENWQSLTKQLHFANTQNSHLGGPNVGQITPKLDDPYVSDGNSSWEEGSFATGASRTVSRVDIAYDDEDDAGTYDETVDGTEYYSDDDTYAEQNNDRPFVRILKKVRDMNADEDQSLDEEEDEGYKDKKIGSKSNYRRRIKKKKKPPTFFESIREIGTDILNETIEYAESQDISPHHLNRRKEGGTIINSFADLFSCGGGEVF